MKICTTTCTSVFPHIIGDAIRSAPWADGHVLVDLGMDDATLQAATEAAEGRPLHVFPATFEDDAAKMRNDALQAAVHFGYDFACTLDTDERLVLNGEDLQASLAQGNVFLVRDAQHGYAKVRFVRVPAKELWEGACHEVFPIDASAVHLRKMRFWELERTPEVHQRRNQSIADQIGRMLEKTPGDPRLLMYRGLAFDSLERWPEAIEMFRQCRENLAVGEIPASVAWMMANSLMRLGDTKAAKQVAIDGLHAHPGMPELPFFAGAACATDGDAPGAICWAHLAIALGDYRGMGRQILRAGHRHATASWEGPYELLAWAYTVLERPEDARQAHADAEAARAMRASW